MTKRNISFLVGLLLLVFIFFIMMIALITLVTLRGNLPSIGRGTVAIITVEGTISDTTEEIRLLRAYGKSPFVRAIILRLETPGGAVAASQELHREIRKTRKESGKPILASMGNVAASGGYYIASAADEIFANPGTVTGSIGVILETYNVEGLSKKIGFAVTTIKSGKLKDTGSPFREMTPEEKAVLQGTIDDTYDQFLEAVLDGRLRTLARAHLRQGASKTSATATAGTPTTPTALTKLEEAAAARVPREVVKQYLRTIADGRVLSGRQACEDGLVDRLGSLQDAIDRAAELGGIRGKPSVLQERHRPTLWDVLMGRTEILSRLAPRHGIALEYRLSFD